jgi:hypothetical protein
MATAKRGQESIQIAAECAIVYDLVADIIRMGELCAAAALPAPASAASTTCS